MSRIFLKGLGSLDLRDESGVELRAVLTQSKRLVLLVYLALAPSPHFRRRDTLVSFFWPDLDQEHARGALRRALSYLRMTLGTEVIVSRGHEDIGVSRTLLQTDVNAFEQALADGTAEAALALYSGDFLDGVHVADVAPELEEWVASERSRLRALARDATRQVLEERRRAGDIDGEKVWARRAVALAGLEEVDLVRCLHLFDESGDRAGALGVYEEFVRRLRLEHDAEPSPETQALIQKIRVRAVAVGEWVPPASRPPLAVASPSTPTSARPLWRQWPTASLLAVGTILIIAVAGAAWSMRAIPRVNKEAYDAYVRGQYYLLKRDTADIRMARDLFAEAIDKDPAFADAHVGLAYAYGAFAHYGIMPSAEAFRRTDAAARKALTLKPASGMAKALLAGTLSFQEWRWAEGERGLREAIAIEPSNADVHNQLGIHLRILGRFDEALIEARFANDLDPIGRHYPFQEATILLCAARYDSALAAVHVATELGTPNATAHQLAAEALAGLGRFDEALAEMDSAAHLVSTTAAPSRTGGTGGRAEWEARGRARAESRLQRLERLPADRFVPPGWRADAYAGVRDWSRSLDWLAQAVAVHDVTVTKAGCNRDYDPIRTDPRFIALMRGVGIPADPRARP